MHFEQPKQKHKTKKETKPFVLWEIFWNFSSICTLCFVPDLRSYVNTCGTWRIVQEKQVYEMKKIKVEVKYTFMNLNWVCRKKTKFHCCCYFLLPFSHILCCVHALSLSHFSSNIVSCGWKGFTHEWRTIIKDFALLIPSTLI